MNTEPSGGVPAATARRLRSLGVAALLTLALVGCTKPSSSSDVASLAGGEGATATTAAKPKTKEDAQDAMRQFAKCMREHGIDMPDPQDDGDGKVIFGGPAGGNPPDKAKMEAANKACEPLMKDAVRNGGPKPDPAEEAKMREDALQFAKCMREHGVDMPDPKFDDGGGGVQIEVKGDPDNPAFQDAQKACEHFMGGPPAGGPGGGGRVEKKSGGDAGSSGGEGPSVDIESGGEK